MGCNNFKVYLKLEKTQLSFAYRKLASSTVPSVYRILWAYRTPRVGGSSYRTNLWNGGISGVLLMCRLEMSLHAESRHEPLRASGATELLKGIPFNNAITTPWCFTLHYL